MGMSEGSKSAISGTPDAGLIEVLRRSRLFGGVAIDEIGGLLASCERRMLVAGQTLLSRNAPNDSIYLLLAGCLRVHLMDPGDEPASRIEVGECAGEMSVIDGDTVSADVVADEYSEVLRIPRNVLWAMVDVSHTIARNLLYILSTRMRYGNELIIRNMHTQRVLEIAATIDALTGVHNRGWMDRSFPRMMARCAEKDKPFCILMVDIDHFKRLNDTWRHVCGDQALTAVAEALLNNVRPEDMLARYGGEEFVIGLPNTDVDDAFIVGERLRRAIEFLPLAFRRGEKLPHVTVSIGIGRMLPGQTVTEVIAIADEALYRAKDAGRNQVML
jgi:diguanylate cyclase (GGDEF)-like protein